MAAKKKTFYITTPLYYPSGNWHLGHSYTTVCCDAIARYMRMCGYDVFYLTGTDDHGQKIHERATAAGKTPAEFTKELRDGIMQLWKRLDISYDKFISTTYDYHVKAVQKIFTDLYNKGDIYKSSYKGKYCTPCESFWTQSQLKEGKCPDCGRDVVDFEEDCYFFRLSKYGDRLKQMLTETDFLSPKSRVNEMVNNFLNSGLTDLAVSRSSVEWGIPVPFDTKHTIYVWIDALSNYITALGYGSDDTSLFDKFWAADLHMVGKEIIRFHTIIWPALLMALDLPVPKKVYGHGWLLLGGDKMSKSKGNVADPNMLIDRYGVDAVRYYLLREVPFGADGVYSLESFLIRYNSDLVNDLGNLVKRTYAMSNQYFGGKISDNGESGEFDEEFIMAIKGLSGETASQMDKITCSKALENIFSVISRANKYIDDTKPWILFKQPEQKKRLEKVLYNLLECIRICATYLTPFLTERLGIIFEGLGHAVPCDFSAAVYGKIERYEVTEQPTLYQRMDIKKELAEIEGKSNLPEKDTKLQQKDVKSVQKETTFVQNNVTPTEGGKPQISIDEFDKCELKVADVIECEKVENAEKLLKLKVRIGEEERTIVSGIAKSYQPSDLIGKQVVVVANLKPVKLKGILSQGMVLCADNGESVCIISPSEKIKSGGTVC